MNENGFCVGEKLVDEKSTEITSIPELLNVKGQIITIDAIGTQKGIDKTIRKKGADYALSLKKNHSRLYEDI